MEDQKPNPFRSINGALNKPKSPESPSSAQAILNQKVAKFNEDLACLNQKDMPYSQKLDLLLALQTQVVPLIFQELAAPIPSVDRSVIASRACISLKEAAAIIIKKREAELSDELNPESPKFQMAFYWFLELVHQTIQELNVDPTITNNVFNLLSQKLAGWEALLAKSMKGLSLKALEQTKNPFIENVKLQIQEATIEKESKEKSSNDPETQPAQ